MAKTLFCAIGDDTPNIGDIVTHEKRHYVVSALVQTGRDSSTGDGIYRVIGLPDSPANRRLVAYLEGSIS